METTIYSIISFSGFSLDPSWNNANKKFSHPVIQINRINEICKFVDCNYLLCETIRPWAQNNFFILVRMVKSIVEHIYLLMHFKQ